MLPAAPAQARYLRHFDASNVELVGPDPNYEPIGADAVAIVGLFDWGLGEGRAPITLSYTALLTRQEGELCIRLEDESAAPQK